jgi:bifunctional DNA-binding transcriptional regulator/antitoxin component of YhaV-PrlF toxin-antitoxin module
MREIVKIRMVAGVAVVTIPKEIFEQTGMEPGDRVMIETTPDPGRLTITVESKES